MSIHPTYPLALLSWEVTRAEESVAHNRKELEKVQRMYEKDPSPHNKRLVETYTGHVRTTESALEGVRLTYAWAKAAAKPPKPAKSRKCRNCGYKESLLKMRNSVTQKMSACCDACWSVYEDEWREEDWVCEEDADF